MWRQLSTGYNECWMLLPESSVTSRSSTMDCRDWCTKSYTGWTSPSESVTSLASWHADPPVSARRSASVPPSNCCIPVAQVATRRHAVCYMSSADRTATSSQHLRSSGIRCRWSDDVQHSVKWFARYLSAQMIIKDIPVLFSAYLHF